MSCPICGGTMMGDGYTRVRHCENADEERVWDADPDCGPIYCDVPEGHANRDGGASTGAERSGAAKRAPQGAPRTAGGSPPLRGEGEGARGDDWVASWTSGEATYDILRSDVAALEFFAQRIRSGRLGEILAAEASVVAYLEDHCRRSDYVFDLRENRWGTRAEFDARDRRDGFGTVGTANPEQPEPESPCGHLTVPTVLQLRLAI